MAYEVTSKSTAHGPSTPHGSSTPHRFPISESEDLSLTMTELFHKLYPTGRAYYFKRNSIADRLHQAINVSFIRFVESSNSTLDSSFPDNVNFDGNDCSLWEYRLGLITNVLLPLADRRQAILRKMNRGRNVPARQHPSYIQAQLQLGGFDVYIHENRFFEGGEWVYKTPEEIALLVITPTQHGDPLQHGAGVQHGGGSSQVIANSIYPNESHSVGTSSLWASFFIGGPTLGDFANIPASREEEFRQLVLTLKPAHLVAFTFINYI
jgi:hypothetical protein